jgi:hypothetical protein
MARRRHQKSNPDVSDLGAALAAMDAGQLREIVGDMLLELDDRAHGRVLNMIVERAARNTSEWTPAGPSDDAVAEILAFVEAATRVGYADPSDVDDHLQQGTNAFLAKDYAGAMQIIHALLLPISEVEIDLGQHEMVDEVLGADVQACAAQYVVAIYMTAEPEQRALAVRKAIDEMSGVGHFWEPLREMERVAVEPLPELDDFLPRWRALIEDNAESERRNDWDTDQDRWLREVVQRMEGAEGLARVARSTKRADDLRAWCRMLVESRDWKAALLAYDEAAEIVTDKAYARGDFLDGAALAAQELGRKDLPARLDRAWGGAPSMLRLRRWLGSSTSKRVVRKRAMQALKVCPKKALRQRTFLHVLLGEYEPAAKLLATAPGLGWSDAEHPGHLLIPLFRAILGGEAVGASQDAARRSIRGMGIDELESMSANRDEPRLAVPTVQELVELAGVDEPRAPLLHNAVLQAMRRAAEKRLDGVTENKRRRHYGHAAELVAVCHALDPTSNTSRWVAEIRATYRRYPALQRELNRCLGSP